MPTEVLDRRRLNRALLQRQLLLARTAMTVTDALEHLVGLQSQQPEPPYYALWSRLLGFRPEQLSELVGSGDVVRMALMRSTIHTVTARDAAALRPLLQPLLERLVLGAYGRHLAGLDVSQIAAAARDAVAAEPLTVGGLGAALAQRWPDRDVAALGAVARSLLPLVQLPPRGVWGRTGPAVHALLPERDDVTPATASGVLVRYLRAFGPASVADAQKWCGLTGLRHAVAELGPTVRRYRDQAGATLFDLADAELPDPDVDAPVRLLAPFDNAVLSHADRSRVLGDVPTALVITVNGLVHGTVLVDGFVTGTWRPAQGGGTAQDGGTAHVTVRPFRRLLPAEKSAVAAEAIGVPVGAGETVGDVRFLAPDG